ncbi:unnamed protein product [Sphagnum jensenii]|uniref:Uncharacterized protein n=1 Tax=Sphagnum jensenii TaxID=128206 RepID=A0ABP1C238_9BRYO
MKFCVAAASPADDRAAQPITVCPTPSSDRVEPEPIGARLCGSYPVTKVSASSAHAPLQRGKMQLADEGTKIFSQLVAAMSTLHTKSLDCCTSSFGSG